MDLLDIDVNKRPGAIEIGVQGENKAEGVAFDVTPWVTDYGLGTAYIYNQRNGDAAPYFKELPITSSDGTYTAKWIYDDADTAVAGEGTCQLIYVKNDVVKKTEKYVTVTGKSLGEATGDIPDPYEDLLADARAIYQDCRDQATAATVKAGEAAQHEVNAKTAQDAAAASAAAAAASAQEAKDTFELAGDVSFSVNSTTKKVTMHFTTSESE